MAEMLNMSRLYNAVASCGVMRRAVYEAAEHARARVAFGRPLERHALQRETIADMAVECEAATALTFEAIRRLDLLDAGSKSETDRKLHRALTPLAKLATAKAAVAVASEGIECLGGNGYIEEFVTPRLLRDAQVLPIWEGTTNILSLDLFGRAFAREGAHRAIRDEGLAAIEGALGGSDLGGAAERVREALLAVAAEADRALGAPGGPEERVARDLAMRTYEAFAGALLVAEAAAGGARESLIARRFVERRIAPRPPSGVRGGPAIGDAEYALIIRGSAGSGG
jgi:hypothetical protein